MQITTEIIYPFLSAIGASGILLYFIKRHYSTKDKAEADQIEALKDFFKKADISYETIKLLAYQRLSEEIEKLLDQGFATPAERKLLQALFDNYKKHGWNGDMDERLEKVYSLPTN